MHRKWYYAAIVCGVLAIAADWVGKSYDGRIVREIARETVLKKQGVNPRADAELQKKVWTGRRTAAGIGEVLFVALFIASWMVSRRAGEPVRQVVPIILLIALVLSWFVMV